MSESRTDDRPRVLIRDTLSGQRLEPAPQGRKDSPVSIYLCGVTVYDDAHIGHARTIITFDVLRRYLNGIGMSTRMVQNFTDVDDKIITRARAEGVTAAEISDRYIGRYYDEFDRLNVIRADSYPKATEHIPDIVSFVSDLVDRGSAYVSKNGVYFAVSEFAEYGKLSKKKVDELKSGARIEVDEEKRDPLDFALWKFDDDDPSWDSPWGRGRPGWHIECSAMSTRYLGDCIDIHGGGRDLIFPHHENEIAQSESRTGAGSAGQFARIWMHVGMVTIRGEKMSKSLGNIRAIRQALEDWGPNVIRIFCLSGHYSKPVDYSEENLQECLTKWRQLEACVFELEHAADGESGSSNSSSASGDNDGGAAENAENTAAQARPVGSSDTLLLDAQKRFDKALGEDLNTHMALSALMGVVSETNNRIAGGSLSPGWALDAMRHVRGMSGVLGLEFCEIGHEERRTIREMVSERDMFRKNGMYENADKIRESLALQGIEIIDRSGGTVWIKREGIGVDGRRQQ